MANGNGDVLRFENISFTFGEQPVLRDINFDIGRGESLILLGAAGSGKTVLLKIALGLLKPTGGKLWLFGEDVTALDEKHWFEVRARIGVLFQEGGLFDSLTVEENVAYPLQNQPLLNASALQVQARVKQSLTFVELGHTLEKYPSELSGGMRRRAGIARAIVTQPELLLYDSPTAGLDPITANTIMKLIVKGRDARQATTLLATHRFQDGEILTSFQYDALHSGLAQTLMETVPDRNRYLVLREGEVAFLGTQEELMASTDPYVGKFVRR